MVDREVFQLRLAKLEQYVRDLESLAARGRDVLLADRGLMAQVERWMHLAAEAAIDLAQHWIASEGWRTPETNREAFRTLQREGILDHELAARMEEWAGLRNVLVHLYLEIDHGILLDALTGELDQLRQFSAALSRSIED